MKNTLMKPITKSKLEFLHQQKLKKQEFIQASKEKGSS